MQIGINYCECLCEIIIGNLMLSIKFKIGSFNFYSVLILGNPGEMFNVFKAHY